MKVVFARLTPDVEAHVETFDSKSRDAGISLCGNLHSKSVFTVKLSCNCQREGEVSFDG